MPDDGRQYELYDGEVRVVPSPTNRHQFVLLNLVAVLMEYEQQHGGRLLFAPSDVVFTQYDVVQPDRPLLQRGAAPAGTSWTRRPSAAPDLTVEVISPGTSTHDRVRKQATYARFGVSEYWIVDPFEETIEIFSLDGQRLSGGVRSRRGAGVAVSATHFRSCASPPRASSISAERSRLAAGFQHAHGPASCQPGHQDRRGRHLRAGRRHLRRLGRARSREARTLGRARGRRRRARRPGHRLDHRHHHRPLHARTAALSDHARHRGRPHRGPDTGRVDSPARVDDRHDHVSIRRGAPRPLDRAEGRRRRHSRHRRRRGDRRGVRRIGGVQAIELATRFGSVRIEANGFVDASGDATLSYEAGLDVREPDSPVYGSLNFLIEGYDTEGRQGHGDQRRPRAARPARRRLRPRAARRLPDALPRPRLHAGQRHALRDAARSAADRAAWWSKGAIRPTTSSVSCRAEFPKIFANARIRTYGNPGIRQTRWIVGRSQITVDDIRKGDRPADAAARCAWWVELHNAKDLVHWEKFEPGHVYYIPLGCMIPAGADNIVTAGRCVDGDVEALSAIRVMGPCIAMGAAAAHALDLAGSGPVHADRSEDVPATAPRQSRSARLNTRACSSRRHEVSRRIRLYKRAS